MQSILDFIEILSLYHGGKHQLKFLPQGVYLLPPPLGRA